MNTRALTALAGVIAAAMRQDRTPMGIALAIESAGLLMTPEMAAELEMLRRDAATNRVDGQRLIRAEQRRTELEAVLKTHRKDDQAEISRLRARVAELAQLSPQLALPWAAVMPDEDLHLFLNDLVSAAIHRWQSDPEVPDREVLALVERACAAWRTPGEGYRSDPPEQGATTAARLALPRRPVSPLVHRRAVSESTQKLRDLLGHQPVEDPHDSPLHHTYMTARLREDEQGADDGR